MPRESKDKRRDKKDKEDREHREHRDRDREEKRARSRDRHSSSSPEKKTQDGNSGYVGFANLPNQVHRKFARKGFDFTITVVGESGLGKSTLISSLFLIDVYDKDRYIPSAEERMVSTVEIEPYTVEIDEQGVKVRLTVVDTPGYGDNLTGENQFDAISDLIDERFEKYFVDECGLNRRHIVDHRIHACLYFISPYGYGLKPIDVQFMKNLHSKVNIIPIIAKADALTEKEVKKLKKRVMEQLENNKIKIYQLPEIDADEDPNYNEQLKRMKKSMPFAVIGSTRTFDVKGKKIRGRLYPWGIVDLENESHSDFAALRHMLISHMQDLQEVTHDLHYENYRAQRLASKNTGSGGQMHESAEFQMQRDTILEAKEKELQQLKEMMAKMQAQITAIGNLNGDSGSQKGNSMKSARD